MKVRIFDTTLRDGEQTPGVALSPEQKLAIAIKLDELGVDAIEAGFPVISGGEMQAVRGISKAGLKADVYGLARTDQRDIDAVVDAGLANIHTFIATSDIHMQYKLKMGREQVMERAVESIDYAKSRGLSVEFSAEDATRTDREFLTQIFKAAKSAGVDRLDIPDTVGYSTPQYIAEITRDAIKATGLPISVHCHNDFGLAVANAISGIQAGAQCAHVTINGIGERAGNASLEELVMALTCLKFNEKFETNIKTERIYSVSQYISNVVGIKPQPNKAIVGANAFAHESGIHTHGVLSNPLTYEPISPELVGRSTSFQVGKHAGAHGVFAMLTEYEIAPDKKQLQQILEKVKGIGDSGKSVTEVELLSIAGEVMKLEALESIVKLTGFSVSTGMGNMPYAFVKLNISEKDYTATDYGVGPVDASIKAVQQITGTIGNVKLKDYKLNSIAGGPDANCEVTIKVEDAQGNTAEARSVGKDIVITSVYAMVDGINKLMLKKIIKAKRA